MFNPGYGNLGSKMGWIFLAISSMLYLWCILSFWRPRSCHLSFLMKHFKRVCRRRSSRAMAPKARTRKLRRAWTDRLMTILCSGSWLKVFHTMGCSGSRHGVLKRKLLSSRNLHFSLPKRTRISLRRNISFVLR